MSSKLHYYFIYPGNQLNTGGVIYNYAIIDVLGIGEKNIFKYPFKIILHLFWVRMVLTILKHPKSRHCFFIDLEDTFHLLFTLIVGRLFSNRVCFYVICHHLEGGVKRLIQQWILAVFPTLIITPSQIVANQVHSSSEIKIIHPPLRMPMRQVRSGLHSNERIRLLYVGSISYRKNIKYHLHVLSYLPLIYSLTIVSHNVDQKVFLELIKLIKKLDLKERVHFVFDADDDKLKSYYSKSDVFLFLSSLEGFGMVSIEAMACGLPAVLSNIPAHVEVSSVGKYAQLVPLDDAKLVASTVQDICGDNDQYVSFSSLSIQRATSFVWDKHKVRKVVLER